MGGAGSISLQRDNEETNTLKAATPRHQSQGSRQSGVASKGQPSPLLSANGTGNSGNGLNSASASLHWHHQPVVQQQPQTQAVASPTRKNPPDLRIPASPLFHASKADESSQLHSFASPSSALRNSQTMPGGPASTSPTSQTGITNRTAAVSNSTDVLPVSVPPYGHTKGLLNTGKDATTSSVTMNNNANNTVPIRDAVMTNTLPNGAGSHQQRSSSHAFPSTTGQARDISVLQRGQRPLSGARKSSVAVSDGPMKNGDGLLRDQPSSKEEQRTLAPGSGNNSNNNNSHHNNSKAHNPGEPITLHMPEPAANGMACALPFQHQHQHPGGSTGEHGEQQKQLSRNANAQQQNNGNNNSVNPPGGNKQRVSVGGALHPVPPSGGREASGTGPNADRKHSVSPRMIPNGANNNTNNNNGGAVPSPMTIMIDSSSSSGGSSKRSGGGPSPFGIIAGGQTVVGVGDLNGGQNRPSPPILMHPGNAAGGIHGPLSPSAGAQRNSLHLGVDPGSNIPSSSEGLSLPPLLAVDALSNSELLSVQSPMHQGRSNNSGEGGNRCKQQQQQQQQQQQHQFGVAPTPGTVTSSSVGGALLGMDNFGLSIDVMGSPLTTTSGNPRGGSPARNTSASHHPSSGATSTMVHVSTGGSGDKGAGESAGNGLPMPSHPASAATHNTLLGSSTTPRVVAPVPMTTEIRDAFHRFILRLPGKWVKPVLRALVLQTLTETVPMCAITCHAIHDAFLDLMGEVLHTKQFCREDVGAIAATSYLPMATAAAARTQVSGTGNLSHSSYSTIPAAGTCSSTNRMYMGNSIAMDSTSLPRVNLFYLCCVCSSLLRFHSHNLRASIVNTCRKTIEAKLKEELSQQQQQQQQHLGHQSSSSQQQASSRRSAVLPAFTSTEMAVAITKQLSRGITFSAHLTQGVPRLMNLGSRLFLPRQGTSLMNASLIANESTTAFFGVEEVVECYAAATFESMPSIFLKFRADQRRGRAQQQQHRGEQRESRASRVNPSAAFARTHPCFQQEFVCTFCLGQSSCCLFGSVMAPEFLVGLSTFIVDPMRAIVSAVKATLHRMYNTLTMELVGTPLSRETRQRIRAPPLEMAMLYIRDSRLYFAFTNGIMSKLFYSSKPEEHTIVHLDDDKGNAPDMATSTTAENLGHSSAAPATVSSGRKQRSGAYDMPTIHACSTDLAVLCHEQGDAPAGGGSPSPARMLVSLRAGLSLESDSTTSISQRSLQHLGAGPSRTPSAMSTTSGLNSGQSQAVVGGGAGSSPSAQQTSSSSSRMIHTIVVAGEEFWKVLDAPEVSRFILVMQALNDIAMRIPYDLRRSQSNSNTNPSVSLSNTSGAKNAGSSTSNMNSFAAIERRFREVQQLLHASDGFSDGTKARLESFYQHRVVYFTVVCPRQLQHNESSTPCPHKAEYEDIVQSPKTVLPEEKGGEGYVEERAEKDTFLPLSGAMAWWLAREATEAEKENPDLTVLTANNTAANHSSGTAQVNPTLGGSSPGGSMNGGLSTRGGLRSSIFAASPSRPPAQPSVHVESNKTRFSVVVVNLCSHRKRG